MSHQISDFTYHAGDEIPLSVTVFQADGVTPEDISGATEIRWALVLNAGDTPLITKTLSGPADITLPGGGTDGIFLVAMAKADTVSLAARLYYHEADLTIAAKEETVMTGTVTLKASSLN